MKKFIFILASLSLLLSGCSNGKSVKGTAVNALNNAPLANVQVMAMTSVNVEEDKKYEMVVATTDKDGSFTLKGLSDKYEYVVTVNAPGFVSSEVRNVKIPDDGQTLILSENVKAVKQPDGEGIYIYDAATGTWTALVASGDLKTNEFYVSTGAKLQLPYISVTSGLSPVDVNGVSQDSSPVSNWLEGTQTDKAAFENAQTVSSDTYICMVGNYGDVHLTALNLFPKMTFRDASGAYPGSFELPEGYYPCTRIRGKGLCCSYLGLEAEQTLDIPGNELFSNAIGNMRFGMLQLQSNQYYIIYSSYMSQFIALHIK